MSAIDPSVPVTPRPTVFLSYASEDRAAAQHLRDCLPDHGLEVWYDESDLVGGDAWDQKIRRQIRECDYFMPVVSAHTEARAEGYFRREWRLAVERTLDMADDHVFLLPVVIDDTIEAHARVPEKFRTVQWLRLPGGEPNPALEAFCRRLLSGEPAAAPARRASPPPATAPRTAATRKEFPEFPREEPGQRVRFWVQVAGWSFQSAWAAFQRLPRWVRYLAYAWLFVMILARGCTPSHPREPDLSAAKAKMLQQIASNYSGHWTKADVAKLIAQIATQIPEDVANDTGRPAALLAIPFEAPAGDAAAQKLAGSAFAQIYGRLAMMHRGRVALTAQPLPALDAPLARAQGRAHGSKYVVYGDVAGIGAQRSLTVKVVGVAEGSVLWSKSYRVTGADPAHIAAQVSAKVSSLEGHHARR